MQQLYYEMSILAKAVNFKNLSAAALHVGLSQPQLSRIIAKIEDELKIVLLDRSAKRKSGWTAVAFQLSEIFEKSIRRLETELQGISNNQMVGELHIGTLEGLSDFAMNTCRQCFEQVGVKKITLDIFDLNELEANFLSGNLDVIFTSKSPGRQKFKYLNELGFQKLELIESSDSYAVLSSFEYGRANKKELERFGHIFVSNSLSVRRSWLNDNGGTGHLPTEAKRGKAKDAEPVLMIGSELLNPVLWENITEAISE
ncbi:LysR family transcriptional regulator [Bdellovibrio sp. HCB288]|uniref:LysR family transcriptional regulator n=1 Tax=Bdellovibrio sp. HCB288 TaxID=3394355 RepID=UPI0039B50C95